MAAAYEVVEGSRLAEAWLALYEIEAKLGHIEADRPKLELVVDNTRKVT